MTHRTVPLDFLVRVREIGDWHRRMNLTLSDAGSNYAATEMYNCPHGKFATVLEELTAQIEQQQDSVPAWAWRQEINAAMVADGWSERSRMDTIELIESRALALAQTKGS